MGKLSITGKAEREVSYDALELSVKFYVWGKTTAQTLSTVMEQSEKFLECITAAGIALQDIHIGENSIEKHKYSDADEVVVFREMKIRLKFDMPFVNGLMDMIRKQDFSVALDCDYQLTNRQALHTELLREAIADSKKKAEFIAEIMGQKIIGIDSVEHGGDRELDWMCCEQERGVVCPGSAMPLSDQLEAPLTTESESVDVVWLIE